MRFWFIGLLLMAGPALLFAQNDPWPQIRTWEKAGKTSEAETLVQKTLQEAEKTAENNPMAALPVLQLASQFYIRRNDFEKGRSYLEQILALCQRKEGPESGAAATAWYELGWFQQSQAEYAPAQKSLEISLRLREKLFGRSHESVAECLNGLGVVLENQGKFDLSESRYLEAFALRKELLGNENNATLTTENNLATLYWSRGDYARAEPYFAEVLKIRRRTQGTKAYTTVTSMNNLALLYRSMGDYERAESLFLSVLRLREESLGPLHAFTLTTLHQLGLLYADQREFAKAEPLLLRAARGREKTAGLDHPDTARSFFHLAWFYDRSGNFEKAEPLHLKALDIRRRILGEEHPETAGSYAFLARHYHLQGKLDLAEPVYRKALQLQTKLLGLNHPDSLKTLESLAYLELDRGRKGAALVLMRQAMEIREKMLQDLFTFTSEQQRMDFQKTLSLYHLPATLGSTDDIARVVFRTKGLVLDSVMEDQNKARNLGDPEMGPVLQKLQVVSRELLQGQMKGLPLTASEAFDEQARQEDLLRQQTELQSDFVRKVSGQGKSRRGLLTSVAEVRKAVPAGSVLLEWVRYDAYLKNLASCPSYGVLAVFPDKPMQWIPLGTADKIDPLILRYQKVMRRRVGDEAMETVLRDLAGKIWDPIALCLPAGSRDIILCPDGPLNFVSFATLLDAKSRFLAESWDFSYVSSGRDLLRKPLPLALEKSVTVFANPDYDLPDEGVAAAKIALPLSAVSGNNILKKSADTSSALLRQFDGIQLKALQGSQEEADWLREHATAEKLHVTNFCGKEATEAALNALHSPTILHLATHGLFLSEAQCMPGESLKDLAGIHTASGVVLKSPMQRSMLMLAGAQTTLDSWKRGIIPATESDGIVNASEVGALDLRGTWLVVLSACETGQGQALAGEGVLGLRRGFLMAGAQNLMLTLWPVADRETVPLMRSFYEKAFERGDPSKALAEVQKNRLVELREKLGLSQAVRLAGPFILSR